MTNACDGIDLVQRLEQDATSMTASDVQAAILTLGVLSTGYLRDVVSTTCGVSLHRSRTGMLAQLTGHVMTIRRDALRVDRILAS